MINLYPAVLDSDISDECDSCVGDDNSCPVCGGDSARVLERQLAPLHQYEIELRALHIARHIREMEVEAKVLEDHVEAIAARAGRKRKNVAYLKAWLLNEMDAARVTKVRDEFATVYVQQNPPSIEVTHEELIPSAYKKVRLEVPGDRVPPELVEYVHGSTVMKGEIMQHLRETGEVVPGTVYVDDRRHLRIR